MSLDKLIVFLKAPRLGEVKTRLAKSIGNEAALGAYRTLAETVLRNVAPLPNVELYFTPDDAGEEIRNWLCKNVKLSLQPQRAGDLGERLHRAFVRSFEEGAQRVVIIGSDCPYLNQQDIEMAWAALRESDVVLGPALDGGYWLIGLRQPQKTLFENMKWSLETVFADTFARAKAAGLSVQVLRTLSDVDRVEEWERFQKE